MPVNIIKTEQFAELRQHNGYYVDKTGFLEEFLDSPADANLFTRPRGFGKTLLMSMLAEFFDITKDSRDLFAGLKVSENGGLCREWMNQYPVIFLTLKGTENPTFEQSLAHIHSQLRTFCGQHQYLLTSERVHYTIKDDIRQYLSGKTNKSTLRSSLHVLTRAMSCHYGRQTIVLVDGYDVPLTKAEEKGYYDEMLVFMRGFLGNALKTNPYLKFGILTGVLPITDTSLNNLDRFGIADSAYSDVFGFTQEEVDQLLMDSGFEDKREEIKAWYGGYLFGKQQESYCPWSIMNHLAALQDAPQKAPKAYWVGTSCKELLRDFAKHIPPEEDVQGKVAPLLDGYAIAARPPLYMNCNDILRSANHFWTFLYLAGYLTPASNPALFKGEKYARDIILAIPNREVREIFQDEMEVLLENTSDQDSLQEGLS